MPSPGKARATTGCFASERDHPQKTFFHWRRAANTATGSAAAGSMRRAAATTAGWSQRRKGWSPAPRPGPGARSAGQPASVPRPPPAAAGSRHFPAPRRRQNADWRQYIRERSETRVSLGRAARRPSESAIWAGLPSKSRPQPAPNRVSPQKPRRRNDRRCGPGYAREGPEPGGLRPGR